MVHCQQYLLSDLLNIVLHCVRENPSSLFEHFYNNNNEHAQYTVLMCMGTHSMCCLINFTDHLLSASCLCHSPRNHFSIYPC